MSQSERLPLEIDSRKNDGINVSLWWVPESEPPELFVIVDDTKMGVKYDPIPATAENNQVIFQHPMSYLADLATKARSGE